MIRLIVGLGNPGDSYDNTRHNAGFWCLDRQTNIWQFESKFQALVSRAKWDQSIYLLKPTTFMNRSGDSVSAFLRFYQLSIENVLVVHDELDLLPGGVRLKFGGGSGGHNGIKSIENRCGSNLFWRLRLGIGHPRSLGLSQGVADFVLHPPSRTDRQALDEVLLDIDIQLPSFCQAKTQAEKEKVITLLNNREKAARSL
jgi:PTH1 family peptidyl-tRNA hydrolase